jgi:hypothetical protein
MADETRMALAERLSKAEVEPQQPWARVKRHECCMHANDDRGVSSG